MSINLDIQDVITAVAVLTAVGTLLAWLFRGHNWFLEQQNQSKKIRALEERHKADMEESNEERQLICYCLVACLDGLQQLGANHSVPIARDKMEKHLNRKAHTYSKED